MSKITRTDMVDVLEQIFEGQIEQELEDHGDNFGQNFINYLELERLGDKLYLTVMNGDTGENETFQITVKKVNL
jgi:hypothetical protein